MNMLYWSLGALVIVTALGKDKFNSLCVGISFPLFVLFLPVLGIITGYLCPITMDSALHQADLAIGLDGFTITRWLLSHGWYWIVPPVYAMLPLVIGLGWLTGQRSTLLRASVIGALLAFPLYLIIPACGPRYAYTGYPNLGALATIGPFVPRDCFPSMHLTWALLAYINSIRYRYLFALYSILMVIVTVGSGEHYFIDLIAAVPFTLAVQYLAEVHYERSMGLVRSPR